MLTASLACFPCCAVPMKDKVGKREEKGRRQQSTARTSLDKGALENFKKNCAELGWKVPGVKATILLRQAPAHMFSFTPHCATTLFMVQPGA